jgi:hypothetical protein
VTGGAHKLKAAAVLRLWSRTLEASPIEAGPAQGPLLVSGGVARGRIGSHPKPLSENAPTASNGEPLGHAEGVRHEERAAKLVTEPLDPALQHVSPSAAA